ncbi:MAG: MarC family protein [Candidatus Goldbacteria bacterium]|nr:MarC family protein [Candidatus Goldiibacteriota bacterium]
MKEFILAFIPVFVAMDAIGLLPVYISLTKSLPMKKKKKILYQSLVTAFLVAIFFIFIGKIIFNIIGITINDFLIAGGIILFCISIIDLLAEEKRTNASDEIGVVPLGTPLITGPAVLTASLILIDQYGIFPTVMSIIVNIAITGIIFYFSGYLVKLMGKTGTNAVSKVMSLMLASFAIMMIRKGIFTLFK